MPNDRQNRVVEASLESASGGHSTTTTSGKHVPAAPPEARPVERFLQGGLIGGTIGYAVVAVFFALVTAVNERVPFDIGTLLRGTLFFGTQSGPDAMIVTGPVFAYTGPRLVTFLVAGVFMAWLASLERAPKAWLVAFMMLLFIAAPVVGVPIFQTEAEAALSPLLVTAATSLAVLAMAAYLWILHPAMRAAMQKRPADRTGLL